MENLIQATCYYCFARTLFISIISCTEITWLQLSFLQGFFSNLLDRNLSLYRNYLASQMVSTLLKCNITATTTNYYYYKQILFIEYLPWSNTVWTTSQIFKDLYMSTHHSHISPKCKLHKGRMLPFVFTSVSQVIRTVLNTQ